MKNFIKFILFLIYTVLIFFVKDYIGIVIILAINTILMILFKIRIEDVIKSILNISIFIVLTGIVNWLLDNLESAILICIRLVLVCNVAYIFSKVLTYTELSNAIEKLIYPIKFVGVNTKDVSIIICISITFIPILKEELTQIKNSFIVKGFKFNFINIIANFTYIFKPFFISILQRIIEIADALKAKAYE